MTHLENMWREKSAKKSSDCNKYTITLFFYALSSDIIFDIME